MESPYATTRYLVDVPARSMVHETFWVTVLADTRAANPRAAATTREPTWDFRIVPASFREELTRGTGVGVPSMQVGPFTSGIRPIARKKELDGDRTAQCRGASTASAGEVS